MRLHRLIAIVVAGLTLLCAVGRTEAKTEESRAKPRHGWWIRNGQDISNTNPGNVGIGTTTPTQKLEVNGGLRLNTTATHLACDSQTQGTLWVTRSEFSGTTLEFCQSTPERVTVKTATLPAWLTDHACVTDAATAKIYCFGGTGGAGNISWVLEYTPATDTLITKQATLPTPTWGLSCAASAPTHKIYCFGGWVGGNDTFDEIVEYTPATDTLVTKQATLPSPGRALLSCAPDTTTGKIYCFGGFQVNTTSSVTYLDDIVEYDPVTDTVAVKTARLPHRVAYQSCVADTNPTTGKIYCLGGIDPDVPGNQLDQIVEYAPATDTVQVKAATLPEPTTTGDGGSFCGANAVTKNIYCVGGIGEENLDRIVTYDPLRDTLAVASVTLPSPRGGAACAAHPTANAIFCFGGTQYDGATHQTHGLNEIVEYQADTSSWVPLVQ